MPSDNLSLSPTITSMIRLDHIRALAAFHRYRADSPWWRKHDIVLSTCAALEIHAQLEEEIFYSAVARVLPDDETRRKSEPEQDGRRQMIGRLRAMQPDDSAYDSSFFNSCAESFTTLPMKKRSCCPPPSGRSTARCARSERVRRAGACNCSRSAPLKSP